MRRSHHLLTLALAVLLGAALGANDVHAKGPGEPGGGEPPEFDEAIKEAEKHEGLFDIYHNEKDGRYLMAIRPEQLDKDYMVSVARDTGIGQSFILATMDLGENPIRFRRVGDTIQLLLRNARFTAHGDPEIARAVGRSFSDSLAGSTSVASKPDKGTKAVLVDMKPLFLNDIEGLSVFFAQQQAAYIPDPANSYFTKVTPYDDTLEVGARVHFDGKKPLPYVNLVDPRSLFVTYRFSVSAIPETEGYVPRIADDRVGNFVTLYQDFTDDREPSPYMRYITRWNLKKEQPYAEMSKPVKPITFWLENSIPKQYRKAVADGVLVWNDAFERIGFQDAVVVKQQPDDAEWDPADSRYASVRWFVTTTGSFAIGPSRINPWTGEIYDADIGVSEAIVRNTRGEFREQVDPVTMIHALAADVQARPEPGQDPRLACSLALGATQQAAFGHSLLMARGMEPGSEEEQQYVNDFITHVMAHEVGHTLGLRHNFRASNLHAVDDLQTTSLTTRTGLTGSVMDYIPVNMAAQGQTQGQHWQTTLGTYDYWAVEYAYSEFAGIKTPEDEREQLAAIAGKVAAHENEYGTDEDTGDPRTSRWDIGGDAIEFYEKRLALTHELWGKIPTDFAKDGEGYQVMRRAFLRGMFEYVPAVRNVTKEIGGVRTHRDHVGDPDGRLPFEPVPAARQREALGFLTTHVFASDAFRLSPDLLNRLAPSRWRDFDFTIFTMPRMEMPLHDLALAIQGIVLDDLYEPAKLDSLVDLEMHQPAGGRPFTMMEMFQEVRSAIWSELEGAQSVSIDSFRRGLQRDHLSRMVALTVRPAEGVPEDASTMARYTLVELGRKIDAALARQGADAVTRAHLSEARATIDATLEARLQRQLS